MVLFKIDSENIDEEAVKTAADWIKKGGLVAFPTETVYGLGADATNNKAVKRIFRAKNRPLDNPLIVHISDLNQLEQIAKEIPPSAKLLIRKFWPGPLTLVLKKKEVLAPAVTAGLTTFAARMPSNKIALELIRKAGIPVAAPSANKSGKPSPTRAEHVIEDLGREIDVLIDGGQTRIGIESTVLDMSSEVPRILRPGMVGRDEIEDVIGINVKGSTDKEGIRSPGMMYAHYSPRAKVYLFSGGKTSVNIEKKAFRVREEKRKYRILTFKETKDYYESKGLKLVVVSSVNSPSEYASKIFALFRQLDSEGIEILLVESPPEEEKWLGVLDRLQKAAYKII